MSKTIPMIISNSCVLVLDKETREFKPFTLATVTKPNIPFFHQYAEKIAQTQLQFKEFMQSIYGKKLSKYILAIIVPDDTTVLESIFINEFFVNSGACKAVAQATMAQSLSKNHSRYISISKSDRNIILQYINNNEIMATRYYNGSDYDVNTIMEDAKRLHIDIEYAGVPVFVNNFNMNMDDFENVGQVITPKEFMDKVADIDVEMV